MGERIADWSVSEVVVDVGNETGLLELWRHAPGQGGINPLPLPDRVVAGIAALRPRIARIFIQEFFRPYRAGGELHWELLDRYMDSFAATGARIVAAICLKPREIFGAIDQSKWRPDDAGEWQRLVRELVRRYSVERTLVTHWEIGNEADIGENGGCPYLIPEPADYHEYYTMTIAPILEAFPEARVGGPGAADVNAPLMEGFIRLCARYGTQLDFVSHHLYSDSPRQHAAGVERARSMLKEAGMQAETMVTEFSPGFEKTSTEDQAYEPRRAACVAASVLKMMEAGLDYSFHYHIWDQVCRPDDFEPFFERPEAIMVRHWNEVPHRFGLFGVNGRVRPQYFVYKMFAMMGDTRIAAHCEQRELRVLAAGGDDGINVMLINYSEMGHCDRVAAVKIAGLSYGDAELRLYRIDGAHRWTEDTLEMAPVEVRTTWTGEEFECHVAMPAGSVALLQIVRE